jgi:hypothetical protein
MYAIATGHAVMRDYGATGQSIAVDARGVMPLVPRHIAYGAVPKGSKLVSSINRKKRHGINKNRLFW